MLIPSIDLMGGKIVQLVGGARKTLETDDFDGWMARFAPYPMVQLIDLDAAMNKGSNRELVTRIASRLPCQVGGGVRDLAAAEELLAAGARRVIIGSSLVRNGKPDVAFAAAIAAAVSSERLVFAVDSRAGKVAVSGWSEQTALEPIEMMRALEPWCGAFLYTHIDTEGQLRGFPLDVAEQLRRATARQIAVAGGVRSHEEVAALDALGLDAVVGMAIYTGVMQA
ncbi:MAG TPA: HisA/HisF-related TIM barrel protein [Terriglobales bacterium]|nr:HisA/HisF-related TIM barrel protein [Terriglobales bacterium]